MLRAASHWHNHSAGRVAAVVYVGQRRLASRAFGCRERKGCVAPRRVREQIFNAEHADTLRQLLVPSRRARYPTCMVALGYARARGRKSAQKNMIPMRAKAQSSTEAKPNAKSKTDGAGQGCRRRRRQPHRQRQESLQEATVAVVILLTASQPLPRRQQPLRRPL